jgi:antitoxin (DNA-binding transcriptional repressor) of toxin-antitoxin stability system
MTMKATMININEAKTHLSKYARQVRKGQRIILCDRNKPFAEIRPLVVDGDGLRPFGLAASVMEVPENFNEPDPEVAGLFDGEA